MHPALLALALVLDAPYVVAVRPRSHRRAVLVRRLRSRASPLRVFGPFICPTSGRDLTPLARRLLRSRIHRVNRDT